MDKDKVKENYFNQLFSTLDDFNILEGFDKLELVNIFNELCLCYDYIKNDTQTFEIYFDEDDYKLLEDLILTKIQSKRFLNRLRNINN